MKTKTQIYLLFIPFVLVFTFISCDKEENQEEPSDPNAGILQDVDGNTYKSIKIGDQWWMAENLNTTKFRNGENIPNVTGTNEWAIDMNAAYCNSNNNPEIASVYGRLYNWHAAADGRKICPDGWHIPNNNNWAELVEFLGGNEIAGGKLKQTGTELWNSPNADASNTSGFTALPGGVRNANTGFFAGTGSTGSWWSNSEQNSEKAGVWGLTSVNGAIADYSLDKNTGLSVRCVKD